MPRTVSDWMTSDPPRVRRDTPLHSCAIALSEYQAQYLVVVDEGGRLCGLLGDSEVWRRGRLTDDGFVPHDPDEASLTAQQLTRLVEIEVGPEADLRTALEALVDSTQDALVIIDEERRPVGLLTEALAVSRCAPDLPDGQPADLAVPIKVDKDAPADDVRSLMARRRTRHALVLDDDRLYGVLSFRDVALEERLADATAGALATTPARSAPIGVSLRAAAETLVSHGIGCLPVVDDGLRPTGWLTRSEIVNAWLQAVSPV